MGSLFSRHLVLLSVLGFSFILIFLMISSSGCKESVTDPPEEKPAGYQEDIPWPSMDRIPGLYIMGMHNLITEADFQDQLRG